MGEICSSTALLSKKITRIVDVGFIMWHMQNRLRMGAHTRDLAFIAM
jgi:hypothetical protein